MCEMGIDEEIRAPEIFFASIIKRNYEAWKTIDVERIPVAVMFNPIRNLPYSAGKKGCNIKTEDLELDSVKRHGMSGELLLYYCLLLILKVI
ncbi:hypothetical protein TNIN_48971 [Trichonephila inaurata madagascariensis]|uniref:Uncharacterized protein n=1 Tax=Trichonephila inaurata madagascariensis TaxID=2747483 RepID=A0A8X6WZI3_9ARAC|nr:hypothetical protein TNIN_48971 [Trichonephila inaurata madagascariensis]